VVAGVASGLAAHLELDPVWVRLAFVVLAFVGGLGFLVYIVAWVVMPPIDAVPYPGTVPPARRLYRPRNDRVVCGVASGLAAAMDVDVTWVRLAFVILTFFGGLGVLLYIAGCVLMPSVDSLPPAGPVAGGGPPSWGAGFSAGRGAGADLRIIAGAFFLIIAVIVLASNFAFQDSGLVWGALLIAIGLLFLMGESRPWRYAAAPLPTPSGPGPRAGFPPGPPPDAAAAAPYTPAAADQPYAAGPTYAPYSYATASYSPPSYHPGYGVPASAAPVAWPGSAHLQRRLHLGTLGLAAAVLALGVALLLQSSGVIHLTIAMGFGIVFVVLGLTMVVGAPFGRAGGLLALGICLLPFAAVAVLVSEPLSGGVGNVSFAPQTVSTVQPAYHLIAGQMYVDLSAVDLGGPSVTVTSTVAFGHLVVVVPADTTVDLTASVGAGEESLFGRTDSGLQISSQLDTATGPEPAGILRLTVSVGCGQLTVMTGGPDAQTTAGDSGQHAISAAGLSSAHAGGR
jgi:phage shock protein PspC (stress-responsive transcriptional regulator)/predicted membrane protein